MGTRVFVDTSAIVAAINKRDRNHARAIAIATRLRKEAAELYITNFVFAECHSVLLNRLGADVARAWLRRNTLPIEPVTADDERRALGIVLDQDDKTYSYTDATGFACMERLRTDTAFAFDDHFRQFGWRITDE